MAPSTCQLKRCMLTIILLVEDDRSMRRLECFVLEKEGYTVVPAGSGEEALEVLIESCPDLVLLDIRLPGIDGFTTCQRIREFSQVPIIIVSGSDRNVDKTWGLKMGADDYVGKTRSMIDMVARVKEVLGRSNSGGNPDVPTLQGEESQKDNEIYEGAVTLIVKTTGYSQQVVNLVQQLRQDPRFRLIDLAASREDGSADIRLMLREPLRLKEILLQMEGISRAEPRSGLNEQLFDVWFYITPAVVDRARATLRRRLGRTYITPT